ncbi:MAG: hypothetical protein Q7V88_06515 [Actinomycetota bacterium]|nr:hypothetical protein [Actinomycetota bacterium]
MIYGIDADHLTVWIESFDGAVAYRAGVLCRRHADAMVVPLGWLLDDRREAVPRLFKTHETAPTPRRRPRRHRAGPGTDDTGQLELPSAGDEPNTAAPTPAPAPAREDDGLPWKPVFDQSDDLDGLLTARSPLLSRAFGRRDRPADQ